jgi:hypothetical protein
MSRLDQRRPAGDDQRAGGALERRAERRDRASVGLGGRLHPREVVDVGGVDHAVGRGGPAAQAVEIVQRAALGLGAGRRQGFRGVIRPGKADDLVPGPDQLGNDGRPDESGRAGDEYAHGGASVVRGHGSH